jgi:NAD(P)-dependent dehydrogenase (short-subunit alcohol dehydrogenase family)
MLKVEVAGLKVLVTAGGAGIGRAIVESFAAQGAQVFTCDLDAEALGGLAAPYPEVGRTVCDMSAPDQVAAMVEEALGTLGGLDVLVNNAGIAGPTAPVEEIALEDWQRTQAVNVEGLFVCTKHAVPALKAAGGGCIVNLSSAAGVRGFPLRTPYVASKWAVVGITKSLAMELGPFGIRVNALCPGAVEGERIDRVIAAKAQARGLSEDEMRAVMTQDTSMKTFVTAQDIADMALYLASPSGARLSGQALSIDGNIEVLR